MKKIAEFIKNIKHENGLGTLVNQKLFKLNTPLDGYTFVVTSGAYVFGIPETYIFGTDENGKIANWGELTGSFRGSINHSKAIKDAGYKIK